MINSPDISGVVQNNSVWLGWLGLTYPNSLRGVTEHMPELFSTLNWVVITRIDGGHGTWVGENFSGFAEGVKEDARIELPYRLLPEGGVVISKDSYLWLLEEDNYFSGFDEVWLYEDEPLAEPPKSAKLTSESAIIDKRWSEQQDAVSSWITYSGCALGLGDGAGINFATNSPSIAAIFNDHVRRISGNSLDNL